MKGRAGYKYKSNTKDTSSEIKTDFLKYADPKTHKIQMEGMEKMGTTLGIDIYTDMFITFFFFKCGCKSLEEVKEEEYITGLQKFNVSNLNQLKNKIMDVREELLNIEGETFREFFYFLFKYNSDSKKKIVPMEVIEVYFPSLFGDFNFVGKFLKYIKEVAKIEGLNKTEWEGFLDFIHDHGSTFPNNYSTGDYYPLLCDNFYEWYLDNSGK